MANGDYNSIEWGNYKYGGLWLQLYRMRELQIWRVVTCIIYLTDKSGMWSLSIFLSLTHILTDIHTSSFTPSQAVFHANAYTHTHSLTGSLFLSLKLFLMQTHTHTHQTNAHWHILTDTHVHTDARTLAHTHTHIHSCRGNTTHLGREVSIYPCLRQSMSLSVSITGHCCHGNGTSPSLLGVFKALATINWAHPGN